MEEEISGEGTTLRRCSNCDSVISHEATQCIMCGQPVRLSTDDAEADPELLPSSEPLEVDDASPGPVISPSSDAVSDRVIVFEMKERISPITFLLTAAFALVVITLGILVLMYPADMTFDLVPTSTPVPDLISGVDSPVEMPTSTQTPSDTPTFEPTALPTETPRPHQAHTVSAGETLFGISLRYDVSMDSIANASGIPVDTALQVSQELLVPWPTATPPLVPIEVEIDGELIVADPTGCEVYVIQGGDTLYGIAASFNVPPAAMLQVNRLSELSVLQPGDTICIPTIVFGSELQPTPGPSPTPGPTLPPIGPALLYPVADSVLKQSEGTPALQWLVVKNLEEGEWYMVEMTNLSTVDSHPRRAFTKQTSFQLPESWAPDQLGDHQIRWRVRIVQVTDQREDGSFIYSFGGESSEDSYFIWKVS